MKKKTKQTNYKKNATIQLDKLIFSCTSTLNDNFDEAVKSQPEVAAEHQLNLNDTTLTQTIDNSHRYEYSYTVDYNENHMGQVYFCQYGFSWKDRVKFAVANPVFYNNTQCYLSQVLDDLNLQIDNYTQIDIAIDSYYFNSEQALRRGIRSKDTQLKISHSIIKDRNQDIDNVVYDAKGSRNNPYKVRTIRIRDKSKNKEYCTYNKKNELKCKPVKSYILDFHKEVNPNFKNLYRAEMRLYYDAIKYYENVVIKRKITLDDLLDKEFLYSMFTNHRARLVSIKGKDKKEICLHPNPLL